MAWFGLGLAVRVVGGAPGAAPIPSESDPGLAAQVKVVLDCMTGEPFRPIPRRAGWPVVHFVRDRPAPHASRGASIGERVGSA
jgi:hypothetical protein